MVLFGLDTGLLSEDLRNAFSKNSAVRLYRIKRRAECIIDNPATSFGSSGVTVLSSVLVSAARSMLRSVATRTAEAPWCHIRRGGMISAAMLRKLWWHTREMSWSPLDATFEKSIFKQDLRGVSKNWLPGSRTVPRDVSPGVAKKKNNRNPVSREIADTNFLETKIYSSKYSMAKT